MGDPALADLERQAKLIRAMRDPASYPPPCTAVRLIETHISYVLLTGQYAYKIKKAVDLGFLDFTTLAARRFYCNRELELNRRFAADIYLDVVAIAGAPDRPRIGGDGPVIEYAVKMREFPQEALLTQVLARGALTTAHIDELAAAVAAFHGSAATADANARAGSAAETRSLAIENFTEMEPLLDQESDRLELATLRRWTEQEHAARARAFAERQRGGFVRDCHGDLHLRNVALIDGRVTMFDCIEFNDDMRWSDVMADVAFLVMDLHDRGRPDFAWRFLNGHLALTGDYEGLQVLRFYVAYRAAVRAKVACMRASQSREPDAREAALAECREYLRLARRSAASAVPGVVITHGPTGSGKTMRARRLAELLGAIHIRTDVERKRLHGLAPQSRSGSPLNAGLYSSAETDRTYAHVAGLTRAIAAAGYPVIADGTFLQRRQRDRFRALAAELNLPFAIVDFAASVDTLRARVEERRKRGADASEADLQVLDHQLRTAEPIAADERPLVVTFDANVLLEESAQVAAWQPVFDRLRRDVDIPASR